MLPPRVVLVVVLLTQSLAAAASSSSSSSNGAGDNEAPQPSFLLPRSANFTVLNDTDLPGAQIAVKPGSSALDCAAQCLAMPDCVAVVWNAPGSKYHDRNCGFKCTVTRQVADPGEQAVIVRPNIDRCPAPPTPPPPPPSPPPLVPLPADWAPAVDAAELLYGGRSRLDPLPLYPNIGNGYVGGTLGCFPSTCGSEVSTGAAGAPRKTGAHAGTGSTNCVVSGVLRIAGVYNGAGTRSVRAALPAVYSVFVTRAGGEPVEFAGSALDMQNATFRNRTKLPGCGGRVLEQRWYAHRAMRSVLVYEMELLGSSSAAEDGADESCVVELSSCNLNATGDVDVVSRPAEPPSSGAVVARNCTTRTPESRQAALVTVAMRFQPVGANVTMTPGQTTQFISAMRTSLPDDKHSRAAGPSAAAAADFAEAVSMPPAALHRSHAAAWAALRHSRVELGPAPHAGRQRNASGIAVAAAVNSSFYALLSSIRSDWAGGWGTSPGGLANSAYEGHVFWDMEEWHYPALAPLYPELGHRMMSYRSSRLASAKAEAKACGQAGARYPIESGVLGREVCGATSISQHELHTTGDVAMAHRLQYRVTRNGTWLRESWPVIEGCAQFWAGRTTACNGSMHPGDNFTVLGVIGADERAGIVDDDAYTNALVAETLKYAGWVAGQVGAVPGANWSSIATGMLLPVVEGIYKGGEVHLENRQYKAGQMTEQSDVVLLQYPLLLDMPPELKANDLAYWENHTLANGFYTGDSSYAIAWMAIGRRDMCDAQFFRAFSYQNGLVGTAQANPAQYNPFNIWKERAVGGGHLNFLTGAGGFLQNVIQGYAGWRALAMRLEFRPVLPPFTGLVRLVGLKYAGASFSLEYTATTMTVELLLLEAAAGLAVDTAASNNGSSTRHVLKEGVPLELPLQAFSVVAG